ncbi:MAG: hypothetical protein II295_10675 [Akkermansia sp.]|nr:hypothetical protein [Akkermansia sp.]
MAVTETTTESWGSRLGGSIKGVAIGGVLFLAGIPLLFWNEGRAVKTAKALEEGASVCVKLPNADTLDATMDGKLVHVTGKAVTEETLSDDIFTGLAPTAIRLTRKVEYYQWVENEKKEKKKNVGGSETTVTTYTYSKKWVTSPVDSSSFREAGHDNQVFLPEATDRNIVAQTARYGAFELTPDQINRISGAKPVELKPEYIPDSLKGRVTLSGGYAYVGYPVGGMMAPGMVPGVAATPGVAPELPAMQMVDIPSMPNQVGCPLVIAEGVQYVQTKMNGGKMLPVIAQPTGMVVVDNGTTHAVMPSQTPITPAMPKSPIASTAMVPNVGLVNIYRVGAFDYAKLPDGTMSVIHGAATATPSIFLNGGMLQIAMQGAPAATTVGTGNTMPTTATATVQGTANPGNPQVGDVRITWTMIPAEMPVSIVAVQTGSTFAPYVAKDSAADGYTVDLLETGTKTKEEMFQNAENANTMMTWILRIVGWIMMYMGLKMIFKPLEVLGDVLPILGDLIGVGTGVLAFLIATPVALITIGIAWLFYRPVLGIILLAAAIGLIVLLIKKKAAAKAAKEAAAPAEEAPAEQAE